MKKRLSLFLLLLALAAIIRPAGFQRRHWHVECSLGFALLSPDDLNARLEAQQQRLQFLYRDNYDWQQRLAGGLFSYVLDQPAGSGLRGLSHGVPVALRVGRAIGPRIAVFAGLQFLGRRETSWLQQTYRISDQRSDQVTPPGSFVVDVSFPEYFLEARAWIPHLGVAVEFWRRRHWTTSARFSVGPMLASLRMIESQHYKKTEADGYWSEWREAYDMKGRGMGVAAETAVRLELEILPRLSLCAEGGYALRLGSRFSGSGFYEYQYRDANAAQNPQLRRWENGRWRTRRIGYNRDWGELVCTLSGNDMDGLANTEAFRLDLSGWQLAVGVILSL